MDLDSAFRQAEEFLRRHIKSKAVREAEKRRAERQSREAARRVRRAAWVGGASGAAILAYAALVAPLAGPALAAAGGGTLLLVVAALARSSRARGRDGEFSQVELAALPGDAEDWLLARREALPLECRPLLDRIFQRLGDLQPHLGALPPYSTRAWEARRLLGDHLPRLVLAYEALPASARREEPEALERLCTGLATLVEALDDLCVELCRDPLMILETQSRFLESRYRDAGGGTAGRKRPSNRSR